MNYCVISLTLISAIAFLGACGREGDPITDPVDPIDTMEVTPPPMTLRDTLIGTYTGICMKEEVYLNTQNGQWVTLRDTTPGEMKILEMDSSFVDYYTVHAFGLFFNWFYLPTAANHPDTLFVHNYQSVHTEDLAIIPKQGIVIRDQTSNQPSGPGSFNLHCVYMKVE